jgi:hypothetical protein
VELVVVSLTRSGGLALKVQSPVAQLLPLHYPEKEFKIVLSELVFKRGVGYKVPTIVPLLSSEGKTGSSYSALSPIHSSV